ncbi:MAG: 50S ribosomal protein L29 [Candidatus Omnitrophica bacterium]|nr:50S ribosomal protein L29 [Candidatus Omnitrophota bacterium]
MKLKEIKELTTDELIQKEKVLKKELFDLNYQRRVGNVEKPSRFSQIKRAVARILTVIRERELENERSKKNK